MYSSALKFDYTGYGIMYVCSACSTFYGKDDGDNLRVVCLVTCGVRIKKMKIFAPKLCIEWHTIILMSKEAIQEKLRTEFKEGFIFFYWC